MSKIANITQADGWHKGERKYLRIKVVDAADAPLNLTGFALQWMLEDVHSGADVVLKEAATGTITLEDGDGTKDVAVIAIVAADTAALVPMAYRHALWRTDVGSEQVLCEGSALLQDVAQPGEEGS